MGVVRGENSLLFSTGFDNSSLRTGATDAVGIVQNLASSIAKINPFTALVAAATIAFTAIAVESHKMMREFQHAMKEVETISDAAQKDFKGISSAVFELSKISPDAPKVLANAYYEIVSAGYDGAKGLKLLEVSSKAATAGVTDTKTAADGLTTVLNAFKIEAEKSGEVADVMFKTVQLGKTNFSQLASNLSTVAPIAAASNISFEQVSAAVATLTKQGVPTAQAMTQIRSAIIGANEVLGDGWAKTMTLQEAFQLLYKEAGGSQTKLQGMVGRVEAVSAVLGVAGKNTKMATDDLKAMNNAVGASDDAFKRMASSNMNQWQILRNKIKAITEGIGNAVTEMSSGIAGALNDVLDESKSLRDVAIQEAVAFENLKAKLEDANTEFDEKKAILIELKNKYPDYLGSLDLDKVKNENLNITLQKIKGSLEDINDLHERRIELSGYDDIVKKAREKAEETSAELAEYGVKFREGVTKMQEYAKNNGIKIHFKGTDKPSKITDEIRKLYFEALKNKDLELQADLSNILRPLAQVEVKMRDYGVELKKNNKELEKSKKYRDEEYVKAYNTDELHGETVKKVERINSLSKLSEFKNIGYTHPNILKAIDLREKEIKTIAKIKDISKEEYDKNTKILEKYINSGNDKIKEAAKKREEYFNIRTTGNKPDDTKITFSQQLKDKEQEYKNHTLALENNDKELAERLKENYKLKENDYVTYLQNLYKIADDNQKPEILEALKKQKAGVTNKKVEAIPTTIAPVKPILIPADYVKSKKELNKEIQELQKQLDASNSQSERDGLQIKINAKKKELANYEKTTNQKKNTEEDFYKLIQTLSRKGLVNKKKEYKKQLNDLKKNNKQSSSEYKNLQSKIQKINEEIGKDIASVAQQFSGAFSGLSDLFSQFGDEDTAKLMNQLGGVADGIADIASGNIIQGSIKVLTSALSVEVVSDTAKFEKAIKNLEQSIEKLDHVISKSFGKNEVTSRIEAIKDLEELQKQTKKAEQAEKDARKQVKLLGIKLWKKGRGSGTDPAKLEELKEKAEQARRKVEDLKDELNELLTGTNKSTIADGIIESLKEAENSVDAFEKTFDNMIRNAILNSFKLNVIKPLAEKWFKKFVDYSDNEKTETTEYYEDEDPKITSRTHYDNDTRRFTRENDEKRKKIVTKIVKGQDGKLDLTQKEVDELKKDYLEMNERAKTRKEALDKMLSDLGIEGGLFGVNEKDKKGLTGEIQSVTEETAGILEGLFRSMQIDVTNIAKSVQESTQIAMQNSTYLSQIVANTSYNKHLETMDIRLQNIETLLS